MWKVTPALTMYTRIDWVIGQLQIVAQYVLKHALEAFNNQVYKKIVEHLANGHLPWQLMLHQLSLLKCSLGHTTNVCSDWAF